MIRVEWNVWLTWNSGRDTLHIPVETAPSYDTIKIIHAHCAVICYGNNWAVQLVFGWWRWVCTVRGVVWCSVWSVAIVQVGLVRYLRPECCSGSWEESLSRGLVWGVALTVLQLGMQYWLGVGIPTANQYWAVGRLRCWSQYWATWAVGGLGDKFPRVGRYSN